MWNTRTFLVQVVVRATLAIALNVSNTKTRRPERKRWRYVNQSGIAHMPNLFVIHLRCRSQTKRDEIHSSVVMVQTRVCVFPSLTIFPWQWFLFCCATESVTNKSKINSMKISQKTKQKKCARNILLTKRTVFFCIYSNRCWWRESPYCCFFSLNFVEMWKFFYNKLKENNSKPKPKIYQFKPLKKG